MDVAEVITKMHQAGFTLAANGDRLSVSPADRLTDQQRQFIRDHKTDILNAILDANQAGNDIVPANCPLPARLATAAARVCREVHGDSDHQVQAMLDDLATYPSDDWDSLADHFESQLPPPPEPGRERITVQAAGYQFDMDVPNEHVAAFKARASVRFKLVGNGGGGSLLGSPGTTECELREILREKYSDRLESINGAAP